MREVQDVQDVQGARAGTGRQTVETRQNSVGNDKRRVGEMLSDKVPDCFARSASLPLLASQSRYCATPRRGAGTLTYRPR